jgi:hypothetical protein
VASRASPFPEDSWNCHASRNKLRPSGSAMIWPWQTGRSRSFSSSRWTSKRRTRSYTTRSTRSSIRFSTMRPCRVTKRLRLSGIKSRRPSSKRNHFGGNWREGEGIRGHDAGERGGPVDLEATWLDLLNVTSQLHSLCSLSSVCSATPHLELRFRCCARSVFVQISPSAGHMPLPLACSVSHVLLYKLHLRDHFRWFSCLWTECCNPPDQLWKSHSFEAQNLYAACKSEKLKRVGKRERRGSDWSLLTEK